MAAFMEQGSTVLNLVLPSNHYLDFSKDMFYEELPQHEINQPRRQLTALNIDGNTRLMVAAQTLAYYSRLREDSPAPLYETR
jgi:hypothetical protein